MKSVVEGKSQSCKEVLGDGDGETVVVSVLGSDHDDAGLVDDEIVLCEEGMKVFDGCVGTSCLPPLWFLTCPDEVHDFRVDGIIHLETFPRGQLKKRNFPRIDVFLARLCHGKVGERIHLFMIVSRSDFITNELANLAFITAWCRGVSGGVVSDLEG